MASHSATTASRISSYNQTGRLRQPSAHHIPPCIETLQKSTGMTRRPLLPSTHTHQCTDVDDDDSQLFNPLKGTGVRQLHLNVNLHVNRLFMKIFRTGSISVIKECQQNFNFLSIESHSQSHLEIRTAKFLQAFSATKNTLICLLFKHRAVTQLNSIFDRYKPNVIHSASQLARILRYNLS